ncbi:hypothetical protein ACTXT7_005625 [Hymenolepis weldensis]
MMDGNRGKSMRDIFKRMKKQQCKRNVLHQDLGHKSYVLRRGYQFMWTKTTEGNHLMTAKRLFKKLKHPEEQECLWFSFYQKTSNRIKKSIQKIVGDYVRAEPTEVPIVTHAHEISSNRDGLWYCKVMRRVVEKEANKHPHSTKSSLMEAMARAMEDINKDYLI